MSFRNGDGVLHDEHTHARLAADVVPGRSDEPPVVAATSRSILPAANNEAAPMPVPPPVTSTPQPSRPPVGFSCAGIAPPSPRPVLRSFRRRQNVVETDHTPTWWGPRARR